MVWTPGPLEGPFLLLDGLITLEMEQRIQSSDRLIMCPQQLGRRKSLLITLILCSEEMVQRGRQPGLEVAVIPRGHEP